MKHCIVCFIPRNVKWGSRSFSGLKIFKFETDRQGYVIGWQHALLCNFGLCLLIVDQSSYSTYFFSSGCTAGAWGHSGIARSVRGQQTFWGLSSAWVKICIQKWVMINKYAFLIFVNEVLVRKSKTKVCSALASQPNQGHRWGPDPGGVQGVKPLKALWIYSIFNGK